MAATTTVQDLLVAGLARSFYNRPDTLATSATELVRVVDRWQRLAYAIAARLNPLYFGTTITRGYASGGYARPEDAESIVAITQLGADVAVVPYLDQGAETGVTLYEMGGQFVPAAGSLIDPSKTIVIAYSRRPAQLTSLTQTVDAQWPESFNDWFIIQVARVLAVKDSRTTEAQGLDQEFQGILQAYVAFLEHATSAVRTRHGIPKAIAGQGLSIAKGMLGLT